MCGNFGMITNVNSANHQKFIYQGLYIDALRGMDSTGLMTVDSLGDITINKKAMTASDFLNLKKVDDQIGDYSNRVFIGHNRAATRGAVNNQNAHPFQHGHITMVHNGSLVSYHTLPDHTKFTVDSEAVAHSLMAIGDKATLKKLNGAFALVWWDDNDKRLKMARNSQRPLHLASIEGKNTVIWGSEESMLHYVAGRAGLKIKDTWELPIKTIVTFNPKDKDIWGSCIQEEVEYLTYGRANGYDTNGFPHHGEGTDWYGSNQRSKKEREEAAAKVKKEREKTEERFKKRDEMSAKMFKHLGIKKGDNLHFIVWDFKPYNDKYPDMGIWEGCTMDEPYVTVYLYGMTEQAFEIGEDYMGEALSMGCLDESESSTRVSNFKLTIANQTVERLDEDEHAETTIILASEVKDTSKKELIIPEKKSILTISGVIEESSENGRGGTESADVDFLYILGPRGIAISADDWGELTKHGCGSCACDLDTKDSFDVEWMGENKDQPVCGSCYAGMYGKGNKDRVH